MHSGVFYIRATGAYTLPLPLQTGQGVLLPQCGQLTGVTLPLPRQRGQGRSPYSVRITPRPVHSGHMDRRWPFQQAPQEILPVPSHCSQSCMARSSQGGKGYKKAREIRPIWTVALAARAWIT